MNFDYFYYDNTFSVNVSLIEWQANLAWFFNHQIPAKCRHPDLICEVIFIQQISSSPFHKNNNLYYWLIQFQIVLCTV